MKTKIVVLDDDPTGSQTVHSCLLLTQWDVTTLKLALLDKSSDDGDDNSDDDDDNNNHASPSPLFFVLTNTRGMDAVRAQQVTKEVCHNLKLAMEELKTTQNKEFNILLVSRSDSTLRGHYPIETNVIAKELGPYDGHFLIPAFFEGGRITRNATHYIVQEGKEIPCHETEFAQDSVFGYSTAYLPKYVEEKTKGRISANDVIKFTLEDVRSDCTSKLMSLHDNVCCVVDCIEQSDLDNFSKQLLEVAKHHDKKFLFRSGASLLTALANLPPQPIAAENMAQYVTDQRCGIVLVGSHVQKTTIQLNELLKLNNTKGIIVDVEKIRNNGEEQDLLLQEILYSVTKSYDDGLHPVIYTSRIELQFNTQTERLQFGEKVSDFLMTIVQNLPSKTTGFLISKGGITSNDVLSKGLKLKTSRVLGQIIPGCSVVKCPSHHSKFPNMPVVIFPGNVGDEYGLATAFQRLSETRD